MASLYIRFIKSNGRFIQEQISDQNSSTSGVGLFHEWLLLCHDMYEDDGSVFWRNIEWEHEIYEISLEEVEEKQMKKNEKNGGFSKRLYIDHVGIDKSSKWFDYYANNLKKYPVVEK